MLGPFLTLFSFCFRRFERAQIAFGQIVERRIERRVPPLLPVANGILSAERANNPLSASRSPYNRLQASKQFPKALLNLGSRAAGMKYLF